MCTSGSLSRHTHVYRDSVARVGMRRRHHDPPALPGAVPEQRCLLGLPEGAVLSGRGDLPEVRQADQVSPAQEPPAYSCQYCRHQVYPTKGTIFERSTTSLQLWFWAIYLMSSTRCRIPAKQLQREIGVTYKTAWRMFERFGPCSDEAALAPILDRCPRKGDPVARLARFVEAFSRSRRKSASVWEGSWCFRVLPLGFLGRFRAGIRGSRRVRAGPRPSWSRGRRRGWRGPSRGRCRRPCSRRRGPPGRRRPRC